MARPRGHAGLAVIGVSAALACGGGSDLTSPTPPANISGSWNVEAVLANPTLGHCDYRGIASVSASGATFTGHVGYTVVCGQNAVNGSSALLDGRIDGAAVSFRDDGVEGSCRFTGTVSGTLPNDRIDGSLTCLFPAGGVTYTFTGTWTATRAGTSMLRLYNASPDSPPVDILLNGGQLVQDLAYGYGRFYIFARSGPDQLIEVRDNAANVLVDYTASFTDGAAYTFAMIGIAGSRQGVLFTDDTSAAPTGNFKFRVLHLARLGPPMDLYITDPGTDLTTATPVVTGITYPNTSAYVTAPISTKLVQLTQSGTKTVLCSAGPINFTTGQSVSEFVAGAAGTNGGGAPYTCQLVADHS